MIKIIECNNCHNHMVYIKDIEIENQGMFRFKCSCGEEVLTPKENPCIKEIEKDKITKATNEQKYKSALMFINDITFDYDGCKTIEEFKSLIDEISRRTLDVLIEEE